MNTSKLIGTILLVSAGYIIWRKMQHPDDISNWLETTEKEILEDLE